MVGLSNWIRKQKQVNLSMEITSSRKIIDFNHYLSVIGLKGTLFFFCCHWYLNSILSIFWHQMSKNKSHIKRSMLHNTLWISLFFKPTLDSTTMNIYFWRNTKLLSLIQSRFKISLKNKYIYTFEAITDTVKTFGSFSRNTAKCLCSNGLFEDFGQG